MQYGRNHKKAVFANTARGTNIIARRERVWEKAQKPKLCDLGQVSTSGRFVDEFNLVSLCKRTEKKANPSTERPCQHSLFFLGEELLSEKTRNVLTSHPETWSFPSAACTQHRAPVHGVPAGWRCPGPLPSSGPHFLPPAFPTQPLACGFASDLFPSICLPDPLFSLQILKIPPTDLSGAQDKMANLNSPPWLPWTCFQHISDLSCAVHPAPMHPPQPCPTLGKRFLPGSTLEVQLSQCQVRPESAFTVVLKPPR